MKYDHVVCALDGSAEDGQILDVLSELKDNATRMSLVTVIRPPAHVYGGLETGALGGDFARFEVRAGEEAKKRLDGLTAEHALDSNNVVLTGSPAHEIRRYAAESEADLILMGSHCRHGLGVLLGSTANGVLHGAPCNVLIVRIETD